MMSAAPTPTTAPSTCAAPYHSGFGPGQAALRGVGERHRGVEMGAGDRAEREYQRDQHGAGGQRVGEQRDGDVASG